MLQEVKHYEEICKLLKCRYINKIHSHPISQYCILYAILCIAIIGAYSDTRLHVSFVGNKRLIKTLA